MLRQLLSGYAARDGRYDELLSAPGEPRAHWEAFLRALAQRHSDEVADTLAITERELRENGIAYNVYADGPAGERRREVDPLPLLIAPAEWQALEAGIAQRADLLNRVLADLYGPQELLRSGAIPPAAVFGQRGYLQQAVGVRPPGGVHLFEYAADLARSPDGRWWVVADRTQAPAGAGSALENRLLISRVFPQAFGDLHVQRLAPYFSALRDALLHWAPRTDAGEGPGLVVLLTPGPACEDYVEHALLARYLGLTLVEGSDLTVRQGCVWMKTVEGLRRVRAILRRQDDDDCDPLELRSDSPLGVPGLCECARRGTVMLANAFGTGVLESGALLGYLPALCERLLGAPLKLPSVATWWLGEPAAMADAWRQLGRVVLRPLDEAQGDGAVAGVDLSPNDQESWHDRVSVRPERYLAQEWVHASQAPVLERGAAGAPGRLSARRVALRVFAVATPEGYRVMQGGLTRVAENGDARTSAWPTGGRGKDTWVLSERPVHGAVSLLSRTVTPDDLVSAHATLSSRAAESLFWYGRYGERCEATARLLRVALGEVLDEGDGEAPATAPAWVLAQRLGVIADTSDPGHDLLCAATDPDLAFSERLQQLTRVAFALRDRMSPDNWRVLNQLGADPMFQRGASLPVALAGLDRALSTMTTLAGHALDGMARDSGWRFLLLGRHIERLAQLSAALGVAMREGRRHGLDWLLELVDGSVTFRSRYLAAPEWLPVLDMLVRDETHPRSMAFQLVALAEALREIDSRHGAVASEPLLRVQAGVRTLSVSELNPDSRALAALIDELHRVAVATSDDLSLAYFAHAAPRSVLSLAG
jgi:uncharacterized circularly permuted ATP-grasp superfamily protein/uncharacterized alpha-E superfamily protein